MGIIHNAAAIAAANAATRRRREQETKVAKDPAKSRETIAATERQAAVPRRRWVVYDKRTGEILSTCRWRWFARWICWLECLGGTRWCEVCDEDTYTSWIDPEFDTPVRK